MESPFLFPPHSSLIRRSPAPPARFPRFSTLTLGCLCARMPVDTRERSEKSRESRRRKRDRIKDFASRCKNRLVSRSGSRSGQEEESTASTASTPATGSDDEHTAIADSPPLLNAQCRPSICAIPVKEHADLGLSLAGCGFLSTYHFGVISCFMRNGKTLMSRIRRVSGASAGSLVSAILVLAPQHLDRAREEICAMAEHLNSLPLGALTPGFYLGEKLVETVDKFLPADISAGNHRLFISLTHHKTRENRLVSYFPDRAYLIKCLSASCYIPVYSMGVAASPPNIDGQPYVDGGYTNNQPDYSDLRTITVSPFCSANDISPPDNRGFQLTIANQHMKVNFRNILRGAQSIFPPSQATLKYYFDQGYRDAFKFLLENDMLERDAGSSV